MNCAQAGAGGSAIGGFCLSSARLAGHHVFCITGYNLLSTLLCQGLSLSAERKTKAKKDHSFN